MSTKKSNKSSQKYRHRKAGRPTLLTPALIKKLALFLGNSRDTTFAAAACGISRQTLNDWLRKAANLKKAGTAGQKRQLTPEQANLIELSNAVEMEVARRELRQTAFRTN